MTVVRAWVRRGLALRPSAQSTPYCHELDWVATRIARDAGDLWPTSGSSDLWLDIRCSNENISHGFQSKICWNWGIVTGTDTNGYNFHEQHPPSGAHHVVKVRERIGLLSRWVPMAFDAASITATAIEVVMNTLFIPQRNSGRKEMSWSINGHARGEMKSSIYLMIKLEDGRWKANVAEIEAIMSLWRYSVEEDEQANADEDSWIAISNERLRHGSAGLRKRSIRLLGRKEKYYLTNLQLYLGDGISAISEAVQVGLNDTLPEDIIKIDGSRVFGFTNSDSEDEIPLPTTVHRYFRVRELRPEDDTNAEIQDSKPPYLSVISNSSLEPLLAQDMFSNFMWAVAKNIPRLGGETTFRPGDSQGDNWPSTRLGNNILSKLAQDIQRAGLGSLDDIYLSIVPPLCMIQKLPVPYCIVEYAQEATKSHEALGHWKEATDIYLWLFRTCMRFEPNNPVVIKGTAVFFNFSQVVCATADLWAKLQYDSDAVEKIERLRSSLVKELENADNSLIDCFRKMYRIQRRYHTETNRSKNDSPVTYSKAPSEAMQLPPDVLPFSTKEHLSSDSSGPDMEPSILLESLPASEKDLMALTPLHCAIINNESPSNRIAEESLTEGSNQSCADMFGWTPLNYAVVLNKEETVRMLLKQGAAEVGLKLKDLSGWTPLHYAAWHGNESIGWMLLQAGAEVDAQARNGTGALHCAAQNGHHNIATLIFEAGANVDVQDNERWTPLHWAVYQGHWGVADLLRGKGANLTAREKNGRIALHLAAGAGTLNKLALQHLRAGNVGIDAKDRRGLTPLHLAAMGGWEKSVAVLLGEDTDSKAKGKDGKDILKCADIEAEDREGKTALHWAARNGHKDTVERLIHNSAKIEAQDSYGYTALHLTTTRGHNDTVQLLIKHRANIEAQNSSGSTALHLAAWYGYKATVKLLLNSNAKIEAQTSYNETALHLATSRGHKDTVQLLIDGHANIEAQNSSGSTALHRAAWYGYNTIIELLLDNNANTDAQTSYKETALHLAASHGYTDTVKLLIDRGADIEAQNSNGSTALHRAASNGHEATVRLLIKHDANTEAKDSSESTALNLANRYGHQAIVGLLRGGTQ